MTEYDSSGQTDEEVKEKLEAIKKLMQKDFPSALIAVKLLSGATAATAFGNGDEVSSCALTAMKLAMSGADETSGEDQPFN